MNECAFFVSAQALSPEVMVVQKQIQKIRKPQAVRQPDASLPASFEEGLRRREALIADVARQTRDIDKVLTS